MKLEGCCHCRGVRFSVETHHPSPFMRCYCSVCRKVYRARIQNPEDAKAHKSKGQRHW
ncbi:hypothetical protein [Myxococcus sp. SDU36]|uniref:GFA family protein n=1 Tax=Myxococcus sp. SDU36 TaxID=2831967 RepID=UPI002542A43D|nr:hypothetical protein [Myxococcus sp. SDU36]